MNNQELLPFNDELHEDIFKLMILASNEINFWFLERADLEGTEDFVFKMINRYYQFQFNDRSIAPVEYEGVIYKVRGYPYEGYNELTIRVPVGGTYKTGECTVRFKEEN